MQDSEPNSQPDGSAGTTRISRLIHVRGRVQGVFYRATAQMRARELGVCGYARNLPDGSVEVLAHGAPEAVEAFTQWLWTGSAAAHVIAVDARPHEFAESYRPSDFTTG